MAAAEVKMVIGAIRIADHVQDQDHVQDHVLHGEKEVFISSNSFFL